MSTIDTLIASEMPYLRVARRKGKRVRLQNVNTAKMGGWIADPWHAAKVAEERHAAHAAQRERMGRLLVVHTEASLTAYTIAQIRTAGEKVLGITFPSKARKAEMVAAYMAEQTARLA